MSSSSPLIIGLTIAVLAAALVLSGYGAALAVSGMAGKSVATTTATVTTTTTNSSANAPYVVNLVITTANTFNSSAGEQPAFYVLGPNGLASSAKINLPANRLIKLIIVNYDEGNATMNMPLGNSVSGTTDGTVFVASNANINSSQGTKGISLTGGQRLTSVPSTLLAHTFTIPSLNMNIPIPLSTTVVAFFTVPKAGTYTWFCMTACGDAAMSTPGWMTGSLVAS